MKKVLTKLIAIGGLAVAMSGALALAQTAKKAAIQRFGDSDLQVIKTQVMRSTLLIFPEGEELAEVTTGDREFWVIEGKGRFVHVKPSKPGLVTNLNVILKSDRVYCFLLKEISKPGAAKSTDTADVKVVVSPDLDEVTQLRKQRENLEELVGKYEGELKDLHQKQENEKKEAQKKTNDETGPQKVVELVVPKSEPAPPAPKTAPEVPSNVAAVKPAGIQETAAPPTATAPAPAEQPTFKMTYVERREGILVSGGRFLGRFFRKVGRTLRLY